MTLPMIISSFFSGLLGSMGLGGGTVLVVYLTYFRHMSQLKAQGINLVCFIPVAAFSLIVYKRQKLTDRKIILPLTIYGTLGAITGYLILGVLPEEILGKLFGGFLIILALRELFNKR